MRYYGVFREASKVNQILCAVLINVPVFAYGASVGWMSPMTLLLQSDHSPRGVPLTDIEVTIMASLTYLLCMFLDIVMSVMADKLGRKISLMITSVTNAIGWGLLLCSYEVWALILARAIFSVSMACSFVTCPIYTKEISDNSIRGSLGCFVILFQTVGNLFLYIIGDFLGYDTINMICLSIPIIHVFIFLTMPESPSFLVKKGKIKSATKALAWLRCVDEDDISLQQEIDVITKEQEKDAASSKFLLKSILSDKTLRKVFGIAMIVTLAREVCGAIPVLNFAGEIFSSTKEDAGIVLSPNQQAMVLGAVQVFGSILASSVVEQVGRKPLLFVTSVISGLSMCILASWFLLKNFDIHTPSWVPLLTLCLCIFCDSAGLQPISIVIAGEIFSFKYRGTVLAVAMAIASFADFLQLLFFKPIVNTIGIYVAFYFFGVICLSMALYVIFVIPETKSRSIEDIYKDLEPSSTNITRL